MQELKLLVWNVSWMNDLFGPNDEPPAFRPENEPTQHDNKSTVKQRRDNLADIIKELNPDMAVIVEGPNRTEELQLFFDTDIGPGWETYIQYSKRQTQNVGFAIKKSNKFENEPFKYFDTNQNEAFKDFLVDTDKDKLMEQHKFERKPLYVEINPRGGKQFRIVGLHLKSKAIFDALEWSKWWLVAEGDRKKLLAQASRIRMEFLDKYLTEDATKDIPLIVCGDINDGPGLDAAEKKILGSAIERLTGSIWNPELCMGNALFDELKDEDKAKLNFSKISTTSFRDPLFNYVWHKVWIDHVLYTKNVNRKWVYDAQVHKIISGKKIWEDYKHSSDHYPITTTVKA